MSLQYFVDFVTEHGVSVLIDAVFIYIAVQLANIGIKWLKEKLDKGKAADQIIRGNQINLKVQNIIDKALFTVNGNRITVMEFHNSITNISMVHFYYMTCTYEAYREGLLPISQVMKQISVSLYSLFLSNLHKYPYIILESDKIDTTIAKSAYSLLYAMDEKKGLFVYIYNDHKKPLGFLSLCKNDDFSEFDISLMNRMSVEIGTLLSTLE